MSYKLQIKNGIWKLQKIMNKHGCSQSERVMVYLIKLIHKKSWEGTTILHFMWMYFRFILKSIFFKKKRVKNLNQVFLIIQENRNRGRTTYILISSNRTTFFIFSYWLPICSSFIPSEPLLVTNLHMKLIRPFLLIHF